MKREELRQYIETILFDVKGDNESPPDPVVLANASLIMKAVDQLVEELREEYRDITVVTARTVKAL